MLFTGEITVAEIMVMPFKVNDTGLIHFYTKALNDMNFINLIPTTQDIYVKTAYLRASFPKMKTPDSIHVASAIAAKTDVFITNDASICTPKTLDKILLSDFL